MAADLNNGVAYQTGFSMAESDNDNIHYYHLHLLGTALDYPREKIIHNIKPGSNTWQSETFWPARAIRYPSWFDINWIEIH